MKDVIPLVMIPLVLLSGCQTVATADSAGLRTQDAAVPLQPAATALPTASPAASPVSAISPAPLPDDPWTALAGLDADAWASLRRALSERDPAVLDDPQLQRLAAQLLPFLQSNYAGMLRPGGTHSQALPPGGRAVRLLSHDGLALSAAYVPAANRSDKAVIVLHGYGSNAYNAWLKYGFLQQDYNLLLLNQRGHNGQAGEVTLGIHEASDLETAIGWLAQQGTSAFALFGESLGAAVAISGGARWAAGPGQRRFPLKAVWNDAAYADLQHAIGERARLRLALEAPDLPLDGLITIAARSTEILVAWLGRDTGAGDAEAAAAPLRHLPALVRQVAYGQVHSSEDSQTSFENARLLEAAARENAASEPAIWATRGAHADSWRQPDYAGRALNFLRQAFGS